ncbi:MAG TPA: VanZ family protein, partial [Pyrinomonadaceae bacterium]|nr:VanZ family protein [Pyrinomonadaceae bacterium]
PQISIEHIELYHLLVRKAGHFIGYAILGLLAARAFGTSSHSFLRRRWFMAALVFICLYALADEYHQSFVPSRTASIYDSMIDVAGGLTALLVAALGKTRQRRRQNRTPPGRFSMDHG